MTPPRPPSEPSPPSQDSEQEFEQELEEVEQALVALKQRYTQVQTDQRRQAQLQQRLEELSQQQPNNRQPEMKAEIRRIKQQLEVLEVNLESQLLSWNSLKEPFWQAVRFGGLGIVVGWILKSCVG
jgi:hypothetical protein